jgi:hypothetical protein
MLETELKKIASPCASWPVQAKRRVFEPDGSHGEFGVQSGVVTDGVPDLTGKLKLLDDTFPDIPQNGLVRAQLRSWLYRNPYADCSQFLRKCNSTGAVRVVV